MTTSGMKKSEMLSEAISERISEVISKMTSEVISELNEFDRRVKLLIDYGAMKDKDWQNQDVKKRTKYFLKL